MSPKHVHFDIPPTPPLVYSYSSSSQSSGPVTPPSAGYRGSPHSYSPLPSVSSQVHPILRPVNPGSVPPLSYNLSYAPSMAQIHNSYPAHVLHEPATNPPLPVMTIISRHLPWSIQVTPSDMKHGMYVTVMDVLTTIYNTLRLGVTEREFENLPSLEEKRRVNDTFCRRYGRIEDRKASELEKSKGVKRIDFLKGKKMFEGFTRTSRGPEVWELLVS